MANRPSASSLHQLRVRHLRLLEHLVSLGSLHKAARALNVTQPTASAMLKDMELALGGPLFERARNGVRLTAKGRSASARMRVVLEELAKLLEETSAAEPLPVLRLGCLYQPFFGSLQGYLSEAMAQDTYRLEVVDGPMSELLAKLERNEVDCIIGRMPAGSAGELRPKDYFYRPLYEFKTCLVVRPQHPLAGKRKLMLRDLAQYEWILSRSATIPQTAFAAQGLPPPRVRISTSSFIFCLRLLAIGNFVSTAPCDAARDAQRYGLVRILNLRLPQLLTPVAFIAHQSSMANPNLRMFWEAIEKSARPRVAA